MLHLRADNSGFTLVELLVTISIAAILMAIAAPSYQYVTVSSRMADEANSLSGAFWYARSQAVMEGRPVTVCVSNDGATCTAGAWQSGWIIFSDTNGNQTVDAGENVRAARAAFSGPESVAPPRPLLRSRSTATDLLPRLRRMRASLFTISTQTPLSRAAYCYSVLAAPASRARAWGAASENPCLATAWIHAHRGLGRPDCDLDRIARGSQDAGGGSR